MNLTLAYHGRSRIERGPAGLALALAPNLRRDRVAFDGTLCDPLRFREAIGALHDVVISDLRYRPRDRSAYEAYLNEQSVAEKALRETVTKQARQAQMDALPELPEPYSADLERRFARL